MPQIEVRAADLKPGMIITSQEGIELTVHSVTPLPLGVLPTTQVLIILCAGELSTRRVFGNNDTLLITAAG
ncbi:hypothetical protein [Mycobacteroides chelonae]|nr:hypothetical protein [Mycobacteroides chelonae]